ncbi:MAG TPA: pitrilysin family protein [Armatimonadota bacterium]|jgi:predicted Zn-dependent peptidase
MKRYLTILALALPAVVAGAFAQETPGVSEAAIPKGTVRLNRAPVAKEVLKVHFPRPKVYTLPNRLRVYILEDHRVPGTTITLMVRAGSLYCDTPELAEATGAILQDGTTTKSGKEISKLVDDMGAELNTGAGSEYATVGISALSDFTEPMLDILADVALHPSFPIDRLDEYKYRRIAGLPARKSDAESLARGLAGRVNYGTTRYARATPKKEDINAVTREAMIAYHSAAFRPNGATLTVVGDVNPKAIIARVRELLGAWEPSAKDPVDPEAEFAPKTSTVVHLIDRPGSKQTMLRFTNIAIRRNDPDYIPLTVANRILGAGSTGRLFQHIREEKGYTYGAYSGFSAPRWPGTIDAYASVRTEVTGPAAQAFLDEFHRMQAEPPPAEELERAKRTIIGSFARTLESPDSILAKTMEIVRNDLPANYWDTYPAQIEAVTGADVQRVARKYLGEGRIQIIAIGEGSAIEAALKPFGPIQKYDTDINPIAPARPDGQ